MSKMFKEESNYTQVTNSLINNDSISFKAKGIYSYLASKPDGWDFYIADIVKHAKDGKESVQSGVKELEEAGYLKRERTRDPETGKISGYDYLLYNTPVITTNGVSLPVVMPFEGKSPTHSNTNKDSNTKISKIPPNPQGECEYTEEFNKFWNYYGKKGNKQLAWKQWKKLKEVDKNEIRVRLPLYIRSTEKQFRKNAETYLNVNNKHWNNEIIGSDPAVQTQMAKPMRVIKANVPQKTTVAQQEEVLNMLGVLDAI